MEVLAQQEGKVYLLLAHLQTPHTCDSSVHSPCQVIYERVSQDVCLPVEILSFCD